MKKFIGYINQHIAGYVREAATYIFYLVKSKNKPDAKFVIFGRGRSGSTLLVSLLNSHPSIFCDKEILNRRVMFPRLFIQCRCGIFGKSIYGFKLLSYQLRSVQSISQPEQFLINLYRDGYQIIYLTRDNALKQILSKMYAAHRNKWHQKSKESLKSNDKMLVNFDELYSQLVESEKLTSFEENVLQKVPHLKLVYEEDLHDSNAHSQTIKKVTSFLNISEFIPKTDLVKITTENFSDFVENSEQVINFLQKTPYAKYVETKNFQKLP